MSGHRNRWGWPMRQCQRLTLVAAGSAVLAALPVATVFDHATWAVRAFIVVAVMCAAGLLTRGVRTPAWAPTAAMALAGLFALTWSFPSGRELARIIPGPGTFAHFGALLRAGTAEAGRLAAPVSDHDGLLFLAALGVAVVALLVDLFSVVLRRPALAGLPMLAVYSVPVTATTGSTSWIPFVLGAAGFLWLLGADNVDRVRHFGRRFTGDGRETDPWKRSPLTAAGQRLGAAGVGLAILVPLVPFALPGGGLDRIGGGWSRGGTGGQDRAVSQLAMLAGQLRQGTTFDMVRVTATTDPDPYYLRLNILEQLTREGFSGRPAAEGIPVGDGLAGPPWDASVKNTAYRAQIEVLNGLADGYLPTYMWPTAIGGVDRSWTFDPRTAVVSSGTQRATGQRYTLGYRRPDITPGDLRGAPPLDRADPSLADVLAVPPDLLVKSTVERLVQDRTTQYDKVAAIHGFFSAANDFAYDTDVSPDTDIAGFLRNRRGFCVQYAAAFGWLLREAGIPSRVVIGFSRGVKRGDTTTLTNKDLHAWTEVYFPGFGWLPFDATPAAGVAGAATTTYLPGPGATTGADGPQRGGPAPGPTTTSGGPGTGGGTAPPGPADPVRTSAAGGRSTVDLLLVAGPWALGGTLALLLLLSPALTRARIRRVRLARASTATFDAATSDAATSDSERPDGAAPDDARPDGAALDDARSGGAARDGAAPDDAVVRSHAHHAWDELIDTMLDYRLPVHDGETPRATVARLVVEGRLRDPARAGVRLLNDVEEHARYARRPLTGRELRAALGTVRADLAGHATATARLMAVLLPPSVLRRWRSRLTIGP